MEGVKEELLPFGGRPVALSFRSFCLRWPLARLSLAFVVLGCPLHTLLCVCLFLSVSPSRAALLFRYVFVKFKLHKKDRT